MVRVALAGIGGFGSNYARALLQPPPELEVNFSAGIDPFARTSPLLAELQQAGVPVYDDLKEYLDQAQVDVVMVSSPIHLHAPQTKLALAHDAAVLCEKPLAATLEAGLSMRTAEKEAGLPVGIGYQWSFSKAVQALKQDIQAGVFGRPRRLKTMVLWPRRFSYYHRNKWAGRIRMPGGEYVWDSPVNNATAHYLHNMLYLLGEQRTLSALPSRVQAELYCANEIENFDSAALRVWTESGVEVLFYTAHPVFDEIGPRMQFEFERAVITYQAPVQTEFIAHFEDGTSRSYGDPTEGHTQKIWIFLSNLIDGTPPACGIQAAFGQTLCVHGLHKSVPYPIRLSSDVLRYDDASGDRLVWVDGMADVFQEAYTRGVLPVETGLAGWTSAGAVVDLEPELSQVKAF